MVKIWSKFRHFVHFIFGPKKEALLPSTISIFGPNLLSIFLTLQSKLYLGKIPKFGPNFDHTKFLKYNIQTILSLLYIIDYIINTFGVKGYCSFIFSLQCRGSFKFVAFSCRHTLIILFLSRAFRYSASTFELDIYLY